MLATDVSAPEMEALLCGKTVTLRFDHNAMRQAELYWQWSTHGVLGYYGIIDMATRRTYCGLGALCYGAAAAAAIDAGRMPMGKGEFDKLVSYDALRPLAAQIIDCVVRSLPGTEGGAKKRGGPAADDGYPYAGLMAAGLRAGISAGDFWRMSPRAVVTIIRRGGGQRHGKARRGAAREAGGALWRCP